jgi:FkbM family methyltransferase
MPQFRKPTRDDSQAPSEKPPGLLLVDQYVPKQGRVAIDCGANVGKWTRPIAEIFDKVIAIEPDPRACSMNRRKLPSNAELIQAAVGAERGRLEFSIMPATMHSHLGKSEKALEHVMVDVLPLDEFVDQEIDFIKIDVEGAEVDVIRGAKQLIHTRKPMLVIELHNTEDEVREAMSEFDYDLYPCGPAGKCPHCQLACVPRDS